MLLKDQTEKYFDDKIKYDSNQGFRKASSCQINLLNFMDYITDYND